MRLILRDHVAIDQFVLQMSATIGAPAAILLVLLLHLFDLDSAVGPFPFVGRVDVVSKVYRFGGLGFAAASRRGEVNVHRRLHHLVHCVEDYLAALLSRQGRCGDQRQSEREGENILRQAASCRFRETQMHLFM